MDSCMTKCCTPWRVPSKTQELALLQLIELSGTLLLQEKTTLKKIYSLPAPDAQEAATRAGVRAGLAATRAGSHSHHKADFFYCFLFDQCGECINEFRVSKGQFLYECAVRNLDRQGPTREFRYLCDRRKLLTDHLSPCFFNLLQVPVTVQTKTCD